jgi:hypothetical protein
MRFLDYLLEDTQKTVLLHKEGVVANVPSPGRFAVHKLVLGERRSSSEATKAKKDTAQATQLVACLLDSRPGDLWLALDAASEYPSKGFMQTLNVGINKLPENLRSPIAEYIEGLDSAPTTNGSSPSPAPGM